MMEQENNATFIKLTGVSWVTGDGEFGYGDVIVYDQILKHIGDLHESHRFEYALESVINGEQSAIDEWGGEIG